LGRDLDRAVTEKGVLQLLYDLRFLRNALAGGRPPQPDLHAAGGAAAAAVLSQRKRAFAELENSLQVAFPPPSRSPKWNPPLQIRVFPAVATAMWPCLHEPIRVQSLPFLIVSRLSRAC
jgi:hypothetical protein